MVAKENGTEDHSSDLNKEFRQEKEEKCDIVKDYVSSQGYTQTTEDEKIGKATTAPKYLERKDLADSSPRALRAKTDRPNPNKLQTNGIHNTSKKSTRSKHEFSEVATDNKSKNMKIPLNPLFETSGGVVHKPIDGLKEIDILTKESNGVQSVGSDDEKAGPEEDISNENKATLDHRVEELELKIEKLEEELRESAALEISLYSVVPEHGSSAHKVHTPARRLSRLYIHASKHWTQNKRAPIAINTVSGLVLIAKSCGNDVSRLTFWLSNTIVLREMISQAFGSSYHSGPIARDTELNGGRKRSEVKSSSLKWKGYSGNKQVKTGSMQFLDDWQETSTFTAALEKIEAWIFSRIVESVWWQTLTPCMQVPVENCFTKKSFGKLLGPALGDQQQGSFSINLWRSAFEDACQRLCPVRAGGHNCGCLPVMARMVMEQCVARLDTAMFNAILRESALEIPTDPISDPIVDSKVLPIPAGDLSFGSGAQLKNSIGNWSRCVTDLFGMDTVDSPKEDQVNGVDGHDSEDTELQPFNLLNELSDLLMLPKDMIMDKSIRKEVCPSIGIPLIIRILCNFTPDEFCPDPVPGVVLETLNSESDVDRRLFDEDSISGFPRTAASVFYNPPSQTDVAEKVGDVKGKSQLDRNVSIVQRKGYTSDEELEELNSPLTYIIDKMQPSPTIGNGKHKENLSYRCENVRYQLLHEVWSE